MQANRYVKRFGEHEYVYDTHICEKYKKIEQDH